MFNKRRRMFYIDKVFQKKLILLFLTINTIIVAANVVYYLTYIKGEVENNMFRSHISLSNMNELLAGDVVYFNILLALVSLVLVIIFYTISRLKLKSFLDRVGAALHSRQSGKEYEPYTLHVFEEFQEIDNVLEEFIQYTDKNLETEKNRIDRIRNRPAQ